MSIKEINGGVTAAPGFMAAGVHAGVKKNADKKDMALIFCESEAVCGGVFTQNKFAAAPVNWCRGVNAGGSARAIIVNSGNANACTGEQGAADAAKMAEATGAALGIPAGQVLVCSTGVIGVQMPMEVILPGIDACAAALSPDGAADAAQAIMTTDLCSKECAVQYEYRGKTITVGGMAKGSGMIHPNMATMLVFITSDIAISPAMLQKALSGDIANTFNMLSIDGDTSTNDMVTVLANGLAGNDEITAEGEAFNTFMKALNTVTVNLCRIIAGDGEGATKLLECKVSGADTEQAAKLSAKSVVCSSLLKAAMFGADANWGRILCAIGYSGADVDVNKVDVSFRSTKGEIAVCRDGAGIPFSEEQAKEILLEHEIEILVKVGNGPYSACAWGCDLTYDYVKINGDYRT